MPSQLNKPFIIPIFIPHAGCPHRCVFCNQISITQSHAEIQDLSPERLNSIIDKYLSYRKDKTRKTQLSFYGGNFLGLDKKQIILLLDTAKKIFLADKINSIRFSTRPDTISENNLELLSEYPVETIEIGVQSMNDEVLSKSGRGHTALDTQKATILVKKKYELGLQIMTGLPTDNESKSLNTAKEIIKLNPNFVRIYPCVVLKNSPLERLFNEDKYKPDTLDASVLTVKKLYLLFKAHNIKVIRMGLQASDDLTYDKEIIAGPYHPAYGHLVLSEIFFDIAAEIINKKQLHNRDIAIKVHPKSISVMKGIKGANIQRLKESFQFKKIEIIQDASINNIEVYGI